MDDVVLDDQVLVDEIGRVLFIGENAAHFGGGIKNIFRLLARKKIRHGLLIEKIKFVTVFLDDIRVTGGFERSDDRRTYQTAVTGNEYF